MGGQIKDMAIRDSKKYSQGGFSSEITFVTEAVTVDGLTSKHNMSIDPSNGIPVSSQNVHITVNEQVLNNAGVVTRNSEKQFILKNGYILKDGSFIKNKNKEDIYIKNHPLMCGGLTTKKDYYVNLDNSWPDGYNFTKDSILLFERD